MERLTTRTSIMGRKHDIAYGCASIWKKKLKNDKYELIENVVDKLGQLEDIEEELGIDLITLFKARKGIYYKNALGTIYLIDPLEPYNFDIDLFNESIYVEYYNKPHRNRSFAFSDYGKTWALTKEELEAK